MENRIEKLQLFFNRIKGLTFWQRLFGWRALRELSYEAYEEFKSLWAITDSYDKDAQQSSKAIASMETKIEHLESANQKLEKDFAILTQKFEQSTERVSELDIENAAFKEGEKNQRKAEDDKMNTLTGEIQRVRDERAKEKELYDEKKIQKINDLKQTWARHQDETRKVIKAICHKNTIEYCNKVPFRGTPDNTIKICEEFVIFDAKSPAAEDLDNFPNYLKNQTDAVKKYIKEENVKRDIFLVIPSNTLEVIYEYCYNMGAYNVYVVTLDSLEPIILSLKMIENYEFVDQLTPEERQNICRVIGKFAHLTKRRIQIDYFFSLEFISLLTQCKAELPKEILEKVIEFEKAEKFNPPQERRSKQILTKDLQEDSDKIRREAEAKEIVFPASVQEKLKQLPLYKGEDQRDKNITK